MGNMKIERLQIISDYFDQHGTEKTAKQFNIGYETVGRYVRQYNQIMRIAAQSEKTDPIIITMDIETTPMKFIGFNIGKTFISYEQVEEDWHLLSYAWKRLGEPFVSGSIMSIEETKTLSEERLVREIWSILNECDIVIGHYFKGFDVKKINAKFFEFGIHPPAPYRIIDTYLGAKNLGLTSHKLNSIAKLKHNDEKLKTDINLWKRCMNGDPTALRDMYAYNEKDVILNEKIYIDLRPYLKNQPSLSVYYLGGSPRCGACGSTEVRIMQENSYTNVSAFPVYRCIECGAISRGRRSEIDKKDRENLLVKI